jgi:hypothetical protein
VFDALWSRGEAFLARQIAEAELAVLDLRERVATKRIVTEGVEDAERLAREQRTRGMERERGALKWAAEREALLLELERIRAARAALRREFLQPAPTVRPAPALSAPAKVALTDQQIEGLALRLVTWLDQLDPAEAGEAWARSKQALSERYPANLAAEVIHRAEDLLDLLG